MPRLTAVIRYLTLFSFAYCCAFLPSAKVQSAERRESLCRCLGLAGQSCKTSELLAAISSGKTDKHSACRCGRRSALRFGESGAEMSQLDVILFSHFHEDHSGDFPALIKSSWFEERKRPLPVYGPEGNDFMPSTVEIVYDFFGDKHGAYRYLSELLVPVEEGGYKLQPHNVVGTAKPAEVFRRGGIAAQAVRVIHGGVPALGWRVEIGGKAIVFSGDTNGEGAGLPQLAANADLFVAHNAVPEGVTGVERNLHMPPSVIGQIAGEAHVKQLVLSHRMLRTLGKDSQTQTQAEIEKKFSGPLKFANDLDCFPLN